MCTQEMGPSSRVYNTKFTWFGLKLRPKNAVRKRITHHERVFTSWTRGKVHIDLFVFGKFVWTVIPFSIWLYFASITLVSGEKWASISVRPRNKYLFRAKREQTSTYWSPHGCWCILLWLHGGFGLEISKSLWGISEIQGR